MAMKLLGKELDIHTGGIDHIGTHHNNEIAQSEAATGKPFARYWMHNEFINIEGTKISKSLRNTLNLRQLKEHGYLPLAYRYWLLTGHYRTKMNFSFSTLDGAATALKRLQRYFVEDLHGAKGGNTDAEYAHELHKVINDDLNTPGALALLWKLIKTNKVDEKTKRATLLHFDKVLGLGLIHLAKSGAQSVSLDVINLTELPEDIQALIEEREQARKDKHWERADELRLTLKMRGYALEDATDGPKVTRV
jgi:cysteinyl-tRNA synthetase